MRFLIIISMICTSILAKSNTKIFVESKSINNLERLNHSINAKHLFKNYYILTTNNEEALLKEIKQNDKVKFVQRNGKSKVSMLPQTSPELKSSHKARVTLNRSDSPFNDPKNSRVWAFRDAEDYGISANKYYLSPLTRDKVHNIVAVVDTGVDYNHEDLKDNMWVNTAEIPNNGIDDDNNGYVDDIYGIDTLTRDANGIASGNPMASHAHGTHVAGTIAAVQNNNIGIAGLSSSAKIMAIRTVPDAADETDVDIVESFLYAAKHGAKIINCSFGKRENEGGNIVNETITHIGEKYGVLTIAAAGNDRSNNDKDFKYPASFDSDYLLVVASTSKGILWGLLGRGLSSFSNFGKKNVDIAAPGSSVYSTVPRNRYQRMSGTSMASPTTAGVASEVLANFPELTALQLKKVIMNSTIKEEKFKNKIVSEGRIDLYSAIQYALNNYMNL